MRYDDGKSVKLGDIVEIALGDTASLARVVVIDRHNFLSSQDKETVDWMFDSGHLQNDYILVQWLDGHQLEKQLSQYLETEISTSKRDNAPISNTLATSLAGVRFKNRDDGTRICDDGDTQDPEP